MFEVLVYTVVVISVLAFCGKRPEQPSEFLVGIEIDEEGGVEVEAIAPVVEVPEVLEVAAIITVDERITTAVTTDYAAMSIVELKALGKQYNIPGWKAWKKPATAISRLTAIAA